MVCAWKQTAYWKNGETLWTTRSPAPQTTTRPTYGLGLALNQQGRVDEAITLYEKAVQINPDCADAHNNLGIVLLPKAEWTKR